MVKKHPKSSHKKPTKEELEKLAEEAEALEKKKETPKKPPKEPEPKPEPPVDPPAEPEPEPEPEPKPDPKKPDYKKKFSESSREAQKIAAKNKKINEAIDKVGDIPEPTDEEMKAEYPDWDIMEDFSKKLAKEAVMGKRFRENLAKARKEGKKIEKWSEKVDKFVDDPETLVKNPELEGRLDEFKVFATDDANTSIPFKVLIPAFLHSSSVPKKKNKKQMFPKGSPGPSDPGKKDNKLTIEEGRRLRKTDYKKWKRYLTAGRIKIDL